MELVCDQGDEFGIRGFSFGVADGVPEEPLEGVQAASVPGNLDGMADGTLSLAGEKVRKKLAIVREV